METIADVIIAGGGLAGLTSGIHLSKSGLNVLVIEKNPYPKHKVCGEYLSNEVLPYLQNLGVNPLLLNPAKINHLLLSSVSGRIIESDLPLGGLGISRYSLDQFLLSGALENGCTLIEDTVTDISFENNQFKVSTVRHGILLAKTVLGAYGKRGGLDQKLSRNFIRNKSPWLAVKSHYKGHFRNDQVALHNFRGGYCGVSNVENHIINICYLADYNTFKKYKSIEYYQREVLCQNKHLERIFDESEPLFSQPLTISQISFDRKETVNRHMLMVGDTAGLIHPLCGNGMAMAIQSAKIASELIVKYFEGSLVSRNDLEKSYTYFWNQNFKTRLKMGRVLAWILRKEKLSGLLINQLKWFPDLLPALIRQTHGKYQI